MACSETFQAIFICKSVSFLGVKRLSIISKDFQGCFFMGIQLFQVATDIIHSSGAHLK